MVFKAYFFNLMAQCVRIPRLLNASKYPHLLRFYQFKEIGQTYEVKETIH